MATKRRTLRTILQSTTSRKAFRLVSKDELSRVGLSPNTKLLVPKALKRVTLRTVAIKPSELKKVGKTRGVKREKLLERAAKKIVKLDKAATQQTVRKQKRRDTQIVKAEKQTATKQRASRHASAQDFSEQFLARARADIANRALVKKAGGKKKGKPSFRMREDTAIQAIDNRDKRLRGEHIPDGEYQAMLDYMAHYNDPYYEVLRGSPNVKGLRIN